MDTLNSIIEVHSLRGGLHCIVLVHNTTVPVSALAVVWVPGRGADKAPCGNVVRGEQDVFCFTQLGPRPVAWLVSDLILVKPVQTEFTRVVRLHGQT